MFISKYLGSIDYKRKHDHEWIRFTHSSVKYIDEQWQWRSNATAFNWSHNHSMSTLTMDLLIWLPCTVHSLHKIHLKFIRALITFQRVIINHEQTSEDCEKHLRYLMSAVVSVNLRKKQCWAMCLLSLHAFPSFLTSTSLARECRWG